MKTIEELKDDLARFEHFRKDAKINGDTAELRHARKLITLTKTLIQKREKSIKDVITELTSIAKASGAMAKTSKAEGDTASAKHYRDRAVAFRAAIRKLKSK